MIRDSLRELWLGPIRAKMTRLRNVFRNLRLWRRYRLRPLRIQDLELRVPPGKAPDCPNCRDTCCRGAQNTISLRLEDLARLVDAGLQWAIRKEKPVYTEELLEQYPSLRTLQRMDSYRKFPVLARKEDGSCVFLDEAGRCSIYEHRPLRCRRFPYRIDDELRGIVYSSGCQFFRGDGSPETQEALAQAAVETYNAKIRDLVFLEYGREELRALGLLSYLSLEEE